MCQSVRGGSGQCCRTRSSGHVMTALVNPLFWCNHLRRNWAPTAFVLSGRASHVSLKGRTEGAFGLIAHCLCNGGNRLDRRF
jgi:hypothetical protein